MGTNKNQVLTFVRTDGVEGTGFLSDLGGVEIYSVAWPDRSPERIDPEYLESTGIKIKGGSAAEKEPKSESELIADYIANNPEASNKDVVAALKAEGVEVNSSQVTKERAKLHPSA